MLSFDAEALSALYAQMNLALWPLHLAALAAALAMLWLAFSQRRHGVRAIGALLVAAWLCCGLVFHLTYFAGLSFTAPVYGGLFLAQAAVLAWSLLLRGVPDFGPPSGFARWMGLAVMTYALAFMPVIAVFGEGLAAARVFALAPGPTAVFTLGILLLSRARVPLLPLLLPVAWTVIAGATAWSLWIPEDLALPVIGSAVLLVAVWHNRHVARGRQAAARDKA